MKKMLRAGIALTLLTMACTVLAQAPLPQLGGKRAYPEGFISGRVLNGTTPEAGVWVIAETKETNTPFIKIVVTDDQGRYTLPQLPNATYMVWVRGYGLADSAKVKGRPGDTNLDLKAVSAKDALEAAKVYPGDYWLSLLDVPAASNFPGTGGASVGGNGFQPSILSQDDWMHRFKKDCNFCHQLGNQITRTLTHMDFAKLGFKNEEDAWLYRTSLGCRGSAMAAAFAQFGTEGMSKTMATWTRTVANGAIPPTPPRPSGIERNVVVTLWDVGGPQDFMHDEVATDKNNPTVNAYGPIYAVSAGHGTINVVDPVTNDAYKVEIPTRDDPRKVPTRFPPAARPSNFWGMDYLWGLENPSDPHNPMMDDRGRVWSTSKIRANQPDFCKEGSQNKYAKYYPLRNSARQASVYDPMSGKFELIDTCYSTHHLQFASDADHTLYFNELTGPIFGWINTRMYDQTHDEQASQGWCPQIIDTNGDGKITKPWNAWNAKTMDPKLDTEVRKPLYSVIPDPNNANVVWGVSEGSTGEERGYLVRLDRGNNPPETCIVEVYRVPKGTLNPRGVDIDSHGMPWVALAATSQWGRFDRTKCKKTNGAGADKGDLCAEGWKIWQTQGPKFRGTNYPTDFHYFGWVDQHNTSGLGADTPILTGSNSDSLIAFDPKTEKWTYLRVPYPLGFYQRGLDGRIDDPDAGWKGRALYANYGTHLVWHIEGGKGTVGKIVKFQIRPDAQAH
ncbi:MAG TPA: carboxypeptidase-like regulatory domain-containing protein [Steroidobacteraceae bacterium]|nr:carboxypeptidase-like regulatory domain-containing protein [Steroidobacteraceae bacterium]